MPRAGFYNDNEYRAYPFIARLAYSGLTPCPNSAIVDCGFIMGLDSEYDPEEHVVYLYRVTRLSDTFEFEFRTTAPGAVAYPLIFERAVTTPEWASEFVESGVNTETSVCLTEPAWEGYFAHDQCSRSDEEVVSLPRVDDLLTGSRRPSPRTARSVARRGGRHSRRR